MKKLKRMSNEEIYDKAEKINSQITTLKCLFFAALGLGVFLVLYSPLAFLMGAAPLGKACLIGAGLQSLNMSGFVVAGFIKSNQELMVTKEIDLREQIELKTQEYQNEQVHISKTTINHNSTDSKKHSQDEDLTKGL